MSRMPPMLPTMVTSTPRTMHTQDALHTQAFRQPLLGSGLAAAQSWPTGMLASMGTALLVCSTRRVLLESLRYRRVGESWNAGRQADTASWSRRALTQEVQCCCRTAGGASVSL